MRQPRVIAEVIGGVLLGPTVSLLPDQTLVISNASRTKVLGRIPGFSKNIFPIASWPYLNLTSTIALVLFLFLVGLEIDVRVLRSNARASFAISAAGMILPFGLGAAAAIPVYHRFVDSTKVTFPHYILFQSVC